MRSYGVTPLSPPSAAPDFTLRDLQGRDHPLKSLRGDWVLLTFFATWCGPCASEMPSLEGLYQARKTGRHVNQVHILGIATDPENDVRGFAAGHGMNFPVLLDSRGEASRAYQATSIPTSFLIDPGGRVVGMTRGARDWRRMGAMFDALPNTAVAGVTDTADATEPSAPAAQPELIALPPDVAPPGATAKVCGEPRLEKPFYIDVHVTWTGKISDYTLLPPEVHVPEGVEVISIAARTTSGAKAAHIDYEAQVVAHRTGKFALDPIDIRYTPAGGREPLATRLLGPTVEVEHVGLRRLWEHHARTLAAGVAAVVGIAAAGMGITGWRRRQQKKPQPMPGAPEAERFSRAKEQLQKVQQLRMSGNVPAFLHQLLELAPELDPPAQRKTLEALAEAATYGNMRPDDEVLNQLERQAVRKVQTLAPAAQAWEQEPS